MWLFSEQNNAISQAAFYSGVKPRTPGVKSIGNVRLVPTIQKRGVISRIGYYTGVIVISRAAFYTGSGVISRAAFYTTLRKAVRDIAPFHSENNHMSVHLITHPTGLACIGVFGL